jgi:hypothetical protein
LSSNGSTVSFNSFLSTVLCTPRSSSLVYDAYESNWVNVVIAEPGGGAGTAHQASSPILRFQSSTNEFE